MSDTAETRKQERMQRLKQLHQRRFEARKANHAEVVEEDRRSKLPANFEAKQKRKDWQLEEMQQREECETKGIDYDRQAMLNVQADKAEIADAAKRRKKNPNMGFSTFDEMTLRQYTRQTKLLKPNSKEYLGMKEKMGESTFYPSADTILQGAHYPDASNIEKMASDLHKTEAKRAQFSRRRTFDPDAPTDFINERNRVYNQKIERHYGEYTREVKQNIERGTAV